MPSRLNPLLAAAVLAAVSATLSGCPPPCQPTRTCAAENRNCGTIDDGCGQTLNCGTCSGTGVTCGGGGTAGVCGCTAEGDPAFCSRLGKNCGPVTAPDNCGTSRAVANCGACSGTGVTCGGGGTTGVCGCAPDSDAVFCSGQGLSCGPANGTDNCGASRTVANCGTCSGTGATCGGGGTTGVCGCTPDSDAVFCSNLGLSCGPASGDDNCGISRTVASCGTCSGTGVTCGGGGTAGVCGCTPQTDAQFCAARGANCGVISGLDNCGQPRSNVGCGFGCGDVATCGGGGVPNQCGITAAPIAGEVCSLDRLCVEMPRPSPVTPGATFALAANDVWVVGNLGTIQHWDGAQWSGVMIEGADFSGVWASGPTDVWVVGTHYTGGNGAPVILRGGPSGFRTVSPVDFEGVRLYSVSGSGPNDVWILGTGYGFNGYYDYLDRWDGNSLTRRLRFASSGTAPVKKVAVVSPTEQYVIADSLSQVGAFSLTPINNTAGITSLQSIGTELWGGGTGGRVFRRQFGNWVSYSVGGANDSIPAVWGSSTMDVWAFGTSGGGGLVQHFNGSAWSPVAGTWPRFYAGAPSAQPAIAGEHGEVWTVNAGAPVRYSGIAVPRPGPRGLEAISGTDTNHYFVAGDGLLFQNNGGAWTDSSVGAPTGTTDIYVASPTDVWVSGYYGNFTLPDVRRFNGSGFSTTGANVTGVLGAGFGSIWLGVSSNNNLLRWTGTAWAPETTPISGTPGQRITGIGAAPAPGGLYVTTNFTANNAQLMRKDPGGLWTTVNTGTFFRSVVALSDTQIWVGASSSLYFDGSNWRNTFATLDDLSGTSPSNVCGSESGGRLAWRWNGTSWIIVGVPGTYFQDVYCDDLGQLYMSDEAVYRQHP